MKKYIILTIAFLMLFVYACGHREVQHVGEKKPHTEIPVAEFIEISETPPVYIPAPPGEPVARILEEEGKKFIFYEGKKHEGKYFSGKLINRSGEPISGATVKINAHFYFGPGLWYEGLTDIEGNWKLGPFLETDHIYVAEFKHPDYLPYRGGSSRELSIARMESGNSISGKIIDHEGKPLSGAEVYFHSPAAQIERTIITDEEGNYSARVLPSGYYSLIPRSEGKAFNGSAVDLKTNDETVNFTMQPARTVKIKFLTEDEEPFIDCWARLYAWNGISRYGSNVLGYTDQDFTYENGVCTWKNAPPDEFMLNVGWKYYHSFLRFLDYDKVFEPENRELSITPDVSEYTVKMIAQEPPEPTEWEMNERIYLPEQTEITLIDPSGNPFAGSKIEALIGIGSIDSVLENHYQPVDKKYRAEIHSNSDGKFILDFSQLKRERAISFEVKIDSGGNHPALEASWFESFGRDKKSMIHPDKRNGKIPENWTITIPRYAEPLKGKVVDEDGKGIEGACVQCHSRTKITYLFSLEPMEWGERVSSLSDAEGNFVCDKYIPYENAMLNVEARGYISKNVDVTENPIVLKKAIPLTIKLKNEEGFPIVGAMVWHNGMIGGVESPSAGEYCMYLDPQYCSKAECIIFCNMYTPVRIEQEFHPESTVIDVVLKRGKRLSIFMLDSKGNPVQNVRISRLSIPGHDHFYPQNFGHIFSDQGGLLVWDYAPDIEMIYTFDCGYEKRTSEKTYLLKPGEKDHLINVIPR